MAAQWIDATRVQLICPCGTPRLARAANAILTRLLEEEMIQEWGGFTYSSLTPPVFHGEFWDTSHPGQPRWEHDESALIVVDAPHHTMSSVQPFFTALREAVNAIYRSVGEPQAALWITAQPVSILVETDE